MEDTRYRTFVTALRPPVHQPETGATDQRYAPGIDRRSGPTSGDGNVAALTDPSVVAAIQQRRLATVAAAAAAADPADGRAAAIVDTCRTIADQVRLERERLVRLFDDAGLRVDVDDVPDAVQRHELRLSTASGEAPAVVATLERHGFERHPSWRRGAARSFWASADGVTLTRPGGHTLVVRLAWTRPGATGQTTRSAWTRVTRPTPADWAVVELPTALWWAYPAVRPVRLALGGLGLWRGRPGALEPFLSTPTSLIAPLLEVAGLDGADTLADIGCGDGRLLIEGVRRSACRARGFEYDAERVLAARTAVAAAGLEREITIDQGDGLAADLSDVSVIALFLPVGALSVVVPELSGRLRPDARIVAHEQSPLHPGTPRPDRSVPVVAADAVTVAHLWRVGASD